MIMRPAPWLSTLFCIVCDCWDSNGCLLDVSLCLTTQNLEGSNFLAANLYARSVFGEDALVNLSVEKKDDVDGKLGGYIRIRSKTQGIALSLGDRITAVQRTTQEATPATAAAPTPAAV